MPFADTPETRIFYRLDGPEGAPVLMVAHALGAELGMWDPQVDAFAARFCLLRYDSRGHGRSGVPPGPYTIAQLGGDALALIDSLGIERVHFCGLSMGGMVGQWLGVNAPQRIERLILCNTAARTGAPEVWDQRIATVRTDGMAPIAAATIERWFTKPFRERAPEAVARIHAMLLATDPAGYAAACAAVRDMDLDDAIRAIQAPTLVIAGRHDAGTPPELARQIAQAIPGARLSTLDAAHLSNIEAEAAFTAAVLGFLGGS